MLKIVKPYLIALVFIVLYSIIKLPVLSFDFMSFISTLILFFILSGILDMMFDRSEKTSKMAKYNFFIAGFLIVYNIVVPFVTSSPILHAKAYRNLIGQVKDSNFSKDVSPVSVKDIRLVDESMAMKLGDKKLGEDPALGSVAKLGKFHIQSVNGELYWVAPLVHRDIIKWATSMDGTNGYVMVSASNPQDVKLIQKINNKPVKIVYQPEAYLHQDLHRHMYLQGIVNVGMTDFTLEVNDSGKPYWVSTLYDHKIGYSGSNAIGVATVDAENGETKRYSIKDAPKWIDRIQPQEFVVEQIKDWGLYVKGFLNSVISEEGVLVPTEGTSLVYGDDDKSYWYTGITSSGSDESTIGFMLVDTRTKEAKLYKQPGATEIAAMRSAEGKVQEKNYEATFPVMYNIFGTPTYVSSLKDKAGLVKMVAFVSVEDFSILGLGETKEEALRNYREALASRGNNVQLENDTVTDQIQGKISRISQDVKSGNTFYYIMLENNNNIIFSSTSKVSNELPITQVGDDVKITYQKGEKGIVDLIEFENLTLLKSLDKNNNKKIENTKS